MFKFKRLNVVLVRGMMWETAATDQFTLANRHHIVDSNEWWIDKGDDLNFESIDFSQKIKKIMYSENRNDYWW